MWNALDKDNPCDMAQVLMSLGVKIDGCPQNVSAVLSRDILWSGHHFEVDLWWVDEVDSEIMDCESKLEGTISACGPIWELAMHDREDDLCSSDDEKEVSMLCHGMAVGARST